MPIDLRFVFDTNVIVSALLLKHSVSRQAFDAAITSGELLLSLAVISELNDVLKRKQFDKYILEEERMQFLAVLAPLWSLEPQRLRPTLLAGWLH